MRQSIGWFRFGFRILNWLTVGIGVPKERFPYSKDDIDTAETNDHNRQEHSGLNDYVV
jgi:hypothetical protein